MRRREFVTLLGGTVLSWPLAARAQQSAGPVRWIGVLLIRVQGDQLASKISAVFEESLAKLGWVVGRNLAIDYRWGVSDLENARSAVAQILRLSPDIILANGGAALLAAQQATRHVPIVFVGVSDPVERGFVASLAAPGGNTTGFTNLETTMGGKWIELFKDIAPRTTTLTAMFNPASSFGVRFFDAMQEAGARLSVQVLAAHVHDPAEIDAALAMLGREQGAGLMLPPDGFTVAHRRQILDLTSRYHLPLIAQNKSFIADGGLMSYGPDLLDSYRRAASYVDRILRGAKPHELPVQSPTKYELAINLKTAKALGLDVPPTLLARTDEVIE